MRQITLSLPDRQFSFFMKLVKGFDFIKIEKNIKVAGSSLSLEHKRILDGISEAVEEINLHRRGIKKMQTFDEMIAEFKAEGLIP
jgi:hypothetical protein